MTTLSHRISSMTTARTGCAHLLFAGLLLASGSILAATKIDPTVPGKIAISEHPQALGQAGRVIAHENGPFSFVPLTLCHGYNTCPQQLSSMLEYNAGKPLTQQLHFVKLSLQTLKDGSWVISHDPDIYLIPSANQAAALSANAPGLSVVEQLPPGKAIVEEQHNNGMPEYNVYDDTPALDDMIARHPHEFKKLATPPESLREFHIVFNEIDSAQFLQYQQQYGDRFDVYRLKDYVDVDQNAAFNYMLYWKQDPNQQMIDDIDALNLNNRAVLESRGNADAEWVHQHQGSKSGIFFTGRVDSPDSLSTLLQTAPSFGDKMWAIEVETNDNTPAVIQLVNATPYISEVDAMPYGPGKEAFGTGCKTTLLDFNSNVTMTSMPTGLLGCLKMMGK